MASGHRSSPVARSSGLRIGFAAALIGVMSVSSSQAIGASPTLTTISLVDRTVTQDQGTWIVDYRLRHTGKTGVIITPDEISVKVEGWVSNSRVASHALPRWSSLAVAHGPDLTAVSEIISATDEGQRCRERLAVSVWSEDDIPCDANHGDQPMAKAIVSQPRAVSPIETLAGLPLSVAPGSIIRARLRLEHQHILYGDYDPLLSVRAVTLSLGAVPVRDVLALDREQYLAQPRFSWVEPPIERRDTRHAVSGPDSLHLEAHVPGHQYYRYPDRPVRYNTKMCLRFSYLIAAGTDGDCKVKVGQSKETPVAWRQLGSGGFEHCLKTVGRWTKVERVIQTEAEATTLTLEFKIVGETEVGEMWIDDVSLEPVGCEGPGGP
jgi:hypothetical protein